MLWSRRAAFRGADFPLNFSARYSRVEAVSERFDADVPQQLVGGRFAGRKQIHHAEAAGIAVDQAGSVGQRHHHMVMRTRGIAPGARLEVEFAEIAAPIGAQHGKAAGHAEMDEQAVAALDLGENVLCPAREPEDLPPGQARGETLRKGKAQIGTAQGDRLDALALEHGLQSAHHGLDFWKFRHGCG